jgi:hypothetical protein
VWDRQSVRWVVVFDYARAREQASNRWKASDNKQGGSNRNSRESDMPESGGKVSFKFASEVESAPIEPGVSIRPQSFLGPS